jgi:hypothetical protein
LSLSSLDCASRHNSGDACDGFRIIVHSIFQGVGSLLSAHRLAGIADGDSAAMALAGSISDAVLYGPTQVDSP